jgi:hypothetical protein
LWFPKGNKSHLMKFTKKWFESYKIQYVLPNNIVLLVTIEKFETNLVLVNVNKLKPFNTWNLKFKKKKKTTTNANILGIDCKWSLGGKFRHKGGR